MKLKTFAFFAFALLFVALTVGSALADVQTDVLWDDTNARSHTINKGQTAGFFVFYESLNENQVSGRVDLLRGGRVIVPNLVFFSNYNGRDNNYQYQGYVQPTMYGRSGTYTVRSTVTGSTSGRTRNADITLTVVNHPPQVPVNPISINVDEGQLITFNLGATDPDSDPLTFTVTGLPSGAHFDTATQRFSWVPTYTQAGTYGFNIRVTDNENAAVSVPIYVSVNDVPPPVVDITPAAPTTSDTLTCTITPSVNGIQFSWVKSGIEVSTTATVDPALTKKGDVFICDAYRNFGSPVGEFLYGSDAVTIRNSAPSIQAIPNAVLTVNQNYVATAVGTDADVADGTDVLAYSITGAPNGFTLDSNTGVMQFTAAEEHAGQVYTLTLTATDNEGVSVSTSFSLEVLRIPNRAPTIDVPDYTVNEGETLTFTVTAVDPENDPLVYSTRGALPRGASFSDATQTFTWAPDFTQAGPYTVIFTVTDGEYTVEDTSIITVIDSNRAPVLEPIGNRRVSEGNELSFTISAADADSDALTYSASNLPAGAVFDPLTQTFSWTPADGTAAEYTVTFAVSDGLLTDEETIIITVVAVNHPPVIAAVPDYTMNEGETIRVPITVSDEDADIASIQILHHALPGENPRIEITGPNQADFVWTADYNSAGSYSVGIIANDGEFSSAEEQFTITVVNVNRAPVIADLGAQVIDEGQTLTVAVTATDLDGDVVTLSAPTLPPGASFDPATGIFTWTPDFTQARNFPPYAARFTASDGSLTDTEIMLITVRNVNRAPVLDAIGNKVVNEGSTLRFTISATDADGDVLTYSASNLPTGAVFDPSTQTFTWRPTFDQAGSYRTTFTVTDGSSTDAETVRITVRDTNRAPRIETDTESVEINEGQRQSFSVTFSDPDADSVSIKGKCVGISIDQCNAAIDITRDIFNSEENKAVFRVTVHPGFDFVSHPSQEESFEIRLLATDSTGRFGLGDQDPLTSELLIPVLVHDINRAPLFAPLEDQSVGINEQLQFVVSATDADGDALTYSVSDLPAGAVFDPSTQTFTWTPTRADIGSHNVAFTVSDAFGGSVTETVTITVVDTNRAPILAPIGNQEVGLNELLQFTISASDEDDDTLTYSASNLPAGAIFDPSTQTFTWTPIRSQEGAYTVTFTVTDGILTDQETIQITVVDRNRAPALDTIGDKTVNEGLTLTFTISATDADDDTLTYSASNLPAGATFNAATQTFSWTPTFTQSGSYEVMFAVSDGFLNDEEQITITVINVNGKPEILSKPRTTATEDEEYSYTVLVRDDDVVRFILLQGPEGMTLDQNGNLVWMPPGKGRYDVRLAVTDGEFTAYQYFTIVVQEVAADVRIMSARLTPEIVVPGQLASVSVSVDNNGDKDLEDLRVGISLPELGVKRSSGSFDLDVGERRDRQFTFTVPEYLEAGTYLVKITLSNDQLHESTYRELYVEYAG